MTDNNPTNDHDIRDDEERLSRLTGAASPASQSAAVDDDDIVREYEQRYRPTEKPKKRPSPRSYSVRRVDDDDKLWAAVAHGSVWLTFLMAVPTSGISIPFVIFIPLMIYFLFRNRSDYVAFHALQAFVLQLLATIGALLLFIIGGAAWLIVLMITVLLMALLVGIPLFFLWLLVGIVASVLISVMPLAGLVLATIATVRVYTGNDYRYPYIGTWVDRQMAGGFLNA